MMRSLTKGVSRNSHSLCCFLVLPLLLPSLDSSSHHLLHPREHNVNKHKQPNNTADASVHPFLAHTPPRSRPSRPVVVPHRDSHNPKRTHRSTQNALDGATHYTHTLSPSQKQSTPRPWTGKIPHFSIVGKCTFRRTEHLNFTAPNSRRVASTRRR